MAYCKPNIIVHGGNDGEHPLSDVWHMDVEASPFHWTEVQLGSEMKRPLPRVYHAAEVCREGPASGMLVIFGGRDSNSRSLADAWGLRQHRDGRWDWVEAPCKKQTLPEARFQHCEPLSTAVYDTETVEWRLLPTMGRFRHSSWALRNTVFTFGGFGHATQQHPTAELLFMDCSRLHALGCATRLFLQIRLASHASVVQEQRGDFSALVRRISIDKLEEEGRKINKAGCSSSASMTLTPAAARAVELADRIVRILLRPLLTQDELMNLFATDAPFCIPWADVNELCRVVTDIFKEEEMVLNLRAPIKVYGDIHGQYHDLMRLFQLYKMPVEEEETEEYLSGSRGPRAAAPCGDLDSTDYLFLGDYVDRGSHSLETICLLFALKVKYPRQVHLIRGNHEDPAINSLYGFQDECRRRLHEDPNDPASCWRAFNAAFEVLPVAALVEGCVLCLHGGIGGSIHSVAQLEALERPLKVAQVPQTPQEQQVTDLLWSDPTDSDAVLGVAQNEIRDPDGSGRICKFGPDRVHQFLADNRLSLIIRAHECVMDGFERFAGGKLITLFSATNYCNHHQNAGALLYIRRDLTIIPKLIYPANAMSQYITWCVSVCLSYVYMATRDERMTELRPPTPPRAPPRMREQHDFEG
ncbi:kelch repeat domain-containing protein serine threonine protein phosphatase protein [Cyclospora cayetanensis]|uniref:Serine/threonine-protein phosphatase n=1 Tax=Cyclospora cayetanensis TaxID=88456 RepID=A0A1D3D4W4_9EIME|nr:kelch repeat domain-containing protein serine threonine protein phosphatase protein [Cyclospora cayetanensis]